MFNPKNYHIHFIGIGGIGMSAIAEILIHQGYSVSGSDIQSTALTQKLSQAGAIIYNTQASENIKHVNAVVYSSAIQADNCERIEAQKKQIPVIHRSEMLAEIMRSRFSIAVTGSHGKTTTTGIIGEILHRAQMNPTIVVGGIMKALSTNAQSGAGDYIVVEADESDGSLLNLYPSIAVITNIDQEHMDHYGSMEKIHQTFLTFANRSPFYGATVLCMDDPVLRSFVKKIDKKCVTYGIDHSADFMAENIEHAGPFQISFDLVHKNKFVDRIVLHMTGQHNVLNALASIATCSIIDIPWPTQKNTLGLIEGVQRRMDIRGQCQQVLVMDDYGHHPTEIIATLKAIKNSWPDYHLCVMFQPHRYSRTKDLYEQFTHAFYQADQLIILPIYSAGEPPEDTVSSELLTRDIQQNMPNRAVYVKSFDDAIQLVDKDRKTLLLTLGAGDIRKAGELFLLVNEAS